MLPGVGTGLCSQFYSSRHIRTYPIKIRELCHCKSRVIIIDGILEILGWTKDDFEPESRTATGYIDYLLSTDGTPRVVVEAKRLGHTFQAPSFRMHDTDYSLSYFKKAYRRALSSVLDQATTYAHEKGVQFAVITNGTEWLCVQVIPPPGRNIDDLRGYYFGNILADDSNFDLLWELLAKSSVLRGSLEEHFSQLNIKPSNLIESIRSEFGDFHWRKPKSDRFLRDFYDRFFAEIVDPGRRNMLEKCFVSDSRLDQYEKDLKRALRDTAPNFLPIETQDISPEEGRQILLDDAGDQAGRVVLVTGSVGCGKTTLVTKVMVEAKQHEQPNLFVLRVDLIDEVTNTNTDISPTLWRYIEEEWAKIQPVSYRLENLRKYFGKELSNLRHGEYADVFKMDEGAYLRHEAERLRELRNDSEKFFANCWRYYRQKHFGIALIIDNVDRASEQYQEQVYAFAHKLARKTGTTVIVTMREFTFFRGQESGFLDVRSKDTVLHLQTPNLEQLLARRIRYVQDFMIEDHRVSRWKKSKNWSEFQITANEHADMLKRTFLLSENGRDILSLLASIAWHNVRYFLDTVRRLHLQLGTTQKTWHEDEVLAALMTSFDAGSISPVISNIYRPSYANYQCYFLKLRLLLMLIYGLKAGEIRSGVSLHRLSAFALFYGYQTRWTRQAIKELVQERYLECLETPASSDYTKKYEVDNSHSFRTSPLAIILVQKVVSKPIYLCLIGNDLPFHNTASFESYRAALKSTIDVLDDGEFERDAVDLVVNTEMGKIVAEYLQNAYDAEQPPEGIIKTLPEISTTERMLSQIMADLNAYSGKTADYLKNSPKPHQPSLFDSSDLNITSTEFHIILIPEKISEVRIGRSEAAPLIFWALVALKANGSNMSSGVEITDVINTYLVDDHNKKFPNNISRALRGATLMNQGWLRIENSSQNSRKGFGLTNSWEQYWIEVFNIPPPKLVNGD